MKFPFFRVTLFHYNALFLFLFSFHLAAQEVNPQPLLDSIQNKFNKVKDYSADIKIKLDVDFIKIPVRDAKIYFKQPDKIKMKSSGFALLPKRGLNFSTGDLLNKKYQAIYMKKEVLTGISTWVVKIVPLDDKAEILLATLWIDPSKQLIRKIDATTKSNGSFTIHFDYPIPANPFDLPKILSFDFDVNKMEKLFVFHLIFRLYFHLAVKQRVAIIFLLMFLLLKIKMLFTNMLK